MEYRINVSKTFIEQIYDILEYINKDLKNSKASSRLRKKIKESFKQITRFPKIYPRIDKKDRDNRVYRRIPIYNYVILYTIIEKDRTIFILSKKKLFKLRF